MGVSCVGEPYYARRGRSALYKIVHVLRVYSYINVSVCMEGSFWRYLPGYTCSTSDIVGEEIAPSKIQDNVTAEKRNNTPRQCRDTSTLLSTKSIVCTSLVRLPSRTHYCRYILPPPHTVGLIACTKCLYLLPHVLYL